MNSLHDLNIWNSIIKFDVYLYSNNVS